MIKSQDQVWSSGLVIRDLPLIASNFRNQDNLSSYLKINKVVAIADIDTRQLNKNFEEEWGTSWLHHQFGESNN